MILDTFKQLSETRHDDIERWLSARRKEASPFFYTSVDLRHSGLRLAPVDTNLFPAGFNNLSPAARVRASKVIARLLAEQYPSVKNVLIIPENHTRNLAYLENLATLLALFADAGVEAQLGSLAAAKGEPIALESLSGAALTEHPLVRSGNVIALENGFSPELIIMNNDMTAGSPEILEGLTQPVIPPLGMGWYRRRKSVHFCAYKKLAEDFAKEFSLDPWLLSAEFHRCGTVDFKEREGLDCLAKGVEKVLAAAREKHKQYGISEDPYVFIKADSGTYGMGIMTVRSADEVFEMNKKDRNKMNVIKEGARVSEVIIQEGIPTVDVVSEKVAEPMVYMIDGIPVGGMYRVNGQRDALGNLNAAGMEFTGMCDEEESNCGKWKSVKGCHFGAYGLVAALAALAAAREDYDVQGIGI
ncbi:MAG: glutamate--cysteine ligase [Alphaproteobacteria bacterium]|nr:glutamate--cysteine ligase [Alphaproteobacteria bacterium]